MGTVVDGNVVTHSGDQKTSKVALYVMRDAMQMTALVPY